MPPYSIRLRLHRYYRAKHSNCTIKHPKGTLYLNGKVHVTRGIDYVNSVIFPDTVICSRLNDNSPRLLLLHPVHGGRIIMRRTQSVTPPGVKSDSFGWRVLTSVNMRPS